MNDLGRRRHDGAPAEVRLGARPLPRAGRGGSRRPRRRRTRAQDPRRARPRRPAVEGARARRSSSSRPASSPTASKAAAHLDAGAEKVIISAPAKGEDLTVVLGRERRRLRPGRPPRDLERLVHHQLRRPDGEGARRRVRDQAGVHDDGARLHERSGDPRPAAQGPASRAGRRRQHHPDVDGRREGDRARPAAPQGQAGRHVAMRVPVPDGSVTDLVATARPRGDGGRGERRLPGGVAGGSPRGQARLHGRPHRVLGHRGLAGVVHVRRAPPPW